MRNLIILTIAILAISAAAFAEEKFDPSARAREIAPFIDEQTIAVMHVDFSRVNVDATWGVIEKLLEETGDHDVKELADAKDKVKELVEGFLQAGARDLYWVISLADIPPEPIRVVIPLRPGADKRAIRALLYSGKIDGPTSRPTSSTNPRPPRNRVDVIRNAVVWTKWSNFQRVADLTPHPRPELAAAFAAAGDTAGQILILPTDDNRRVIEEMMPTLPEEFGGAPSTTITQGLLWAAVGVDGPPEMAVRAVVQSKDPAAAEALGQTITSIFKAIEENEDVLKMVPNIAKLTAMLTPAVSGNQLTLKLDDKQANSIIFDLLGPPLREARMQAKLALSMRNLSQIGKAIYIYGAENKDTFPESLQVLLDKKLIKPQMLINPARTKQKPAYVYVKPSQPMGKVPSGRLLVYEAHDTWGPAGVNVLFADAHVGRITNEAHFKKLLTEAQAGKKKPVPESPTK